MALDLDICAHLYAYTAQQPGESRRELLDTVFADLSSAGYAGVEVMHTQVRSADDAAYVGGLSERYNLPVIGASFGGRMWDVAEHPALLAHAQVLIEALGDLDAWLLGVSTGAKPEGLKTPAELDTQAELLECLIDLCDECGILLNLHNHTYEVENGEYEFRAMIERIPDISLGPDVNWLRRAGIEPNDFLRRYADRIIYLHLRDQLGDRWPEALGEGDQDWVELGRTLRDIGFDRYVGIELAHERDTQFTRTMGENFALSLRNLRDAFARV